MFARAIDAYRWLLKILTLPQNVYCLFLCVCCWYCIFLQCWMACILYNMTYESNWLLIVNKTSTTTTTSSSCFVYLGLQVKRNQLSSNNSHHTSCIHKGSHAGKWPDLMTSKPDSASTLGYHCTDHTGKPLEPQVHWDTTGTTLADANTQWCSSGDPVLICIIGTHWKTTGAASILGCHWNHTGWC